MPDLDADTDEARSRGTSSRAREAMAIVDVCVFTQNGECQDANTPQMSISDTKCDQNVLSPKKVSYVGIVCMR